MSINFIGTNQNSPSFLDSKFSFYLIILLWLILNLANYWFVDGDDLASGYIASRILDEEKLTHVYAYTDTCYSTQDDPVWNSIAMKTGFFGRLHPYVQIPIYAYLLKPISVHVDYKPFKHIFLCIILLSMIASIILVFKLWLPELLQPIPFVIFLLLFSISIPFQYSMQLLQTHPIIIFFIIFGIYLEHKGKPFLGGLILSVAIAIKLTPLLIIIYWLFVKRYRAVFGAIIGLLAIGSLSLILVGIDAHIFYIKRLNQINSITLVGFNNQSIRSCLVRLFLDYDAMFKLKMHETPVIVSIFNMIICVILFGFLIIKISYDKANGLVFEKNYISIVLILQTICSPIAWTHYFTILFVPFAIVYSCIRKEESLGSKIFFWGLVLINMPLIAPFPYHIKNISGNNIVLFGFYSSLVLLSYLLLKKEYHKNG